MNVQKAYIYSDLVQLCEHNRIRIYIHFWYQWRTRRGRLTWIWHYWRLVWTYISPFVCLKNEQGYWFLIIVNSVEYLREFIELFWNQIHHFSALFVHEFSGCLSFLFQQFSGQGFLLSVQFDGHILL